MRGLRPQEVSCWLRRRDESKVSEHALVDNTPLDTKSLLLLPSQARHYLHNGHAFEGVVYFPQSPQAGVARRAQNVRLLLTMHLLFSMLVVLFAAVVPRSFVVVVVGIGKSSANGNRIE